MLIFYCEMSQSEAQSIFNDFGNWEFDKVEKQIDTLKTHPNNIIFDKTCHIQGGSKFAFITGSPLFTIIAWNLARLKGMCPYIKYDQYYNCLKRCLQKLKDRGADLEKRNTDEREYTTGLRQALTNTYDNCPNDLFEFLLSLGCQINNHEYNWLMEYLIVHPNHEYFKIALKYGLNIGGKIWVGHNVPSISVKQRYYAIWQKKIENYYKSPNSKQYEQHKFEQAFKMKSFIDTGKADIIWAEIKREQDDKARKEREILEKERLEKERLEKERLEKERLEKERLERERLAKIKAEQDRLEAERLAKEKAIKDEQDRLEAERLAKEKAIKDEHDRLEAQRLANIEAEKERQCELQRKQTQDNAYLETALANSNKCKEVIQYLPDDFVNHNIDFLNELLSMLNHPDNVDKTKILENIQYMESNKNNDPELGLDEKSRDEMGGAYFRLATTNSESLIRFKNMFSSQFTKYLTEYTDALFAMADEHIHPSHKKKLLNGF